MEITTGNKHLNYLSEAELNEALNTSVFILSLLCLNFVFITCSHGIKNKNETPLTYPVTFDTRNIDDSSSLVVKKVIDPATTVGTLPEKPTETGYYFAGWCTEINIFCKLVHEDKWC